MLIYSTNFCFVKLSLDFAEKRFNYTLKSDIEKNILNNSSILSYPNLFYSIGFGYLTPFITGGNNDLWSFIKSGYILSFAIFSLFSLSMVYYKINTTIKNELKANLVPYGGISAKMRIRQVFMSGLIYSLIISSLGLLVFYDSSLFSTTIGYDEKSSILLKYFLFVPSLSLFIGNFIENR